MSYSSVDKAPLPTYEMWPRPGSGGAARMK
jgi:hypothetical protein